MNLRYVQSLDELDTVREVIDRINAGETVSRNEQIMLVARIVNLETALLSIRLILTDSPAQIATVRVIIGDMHVE